VCCAVWGGFAGIVFGEALAEVFGEAGVDLIRGGLATEKVDVIHRALFWEMRKGGGKQRFCGESFALGRREWPVLRSASYGGHFSPTLSAKNGGEGGIRTLGCLTTTSDFESAVLIIHKIFTVNCLYKYWRPDEAH
jgi:hypothetical protein